MSKHKEGARGWTSLCVALLAAGALPAQQPVDVVQITAKASERNIALPGEFLPFQVVEVHAKVTGFVEKVLVDRGSVVREGDLLATLVAPELTAQRAAAEAKVQAEAAQRAVAQAQLVAAESTYERLHAASRTPGAVAGNELVVAKNGVEAAQAQVRATESSIVAAQAAVAALRDMESYLRVAAPAARGAPRRLSPCRPGRARRSTGRWPGWRSRWTRKRAPWRWNWTWPTPAGRSRRACIPR